MGQQGETPAPRAAVLGDVVRDGHLLWVSCAACPHRARLAPAELARFVGYDRPLGRIPFRCSQCGGRAAEVRIEVQGKGAPGQYRYPTWGPPE